jgi:hypothetical protein
MINIHHSIIAGDETGAILKAELEKNGVPAFITLRSVQ